MRPESKQALPPRHLGDGHAGGNDLHGADAVVPQQELAHDLELREPGPGGAPAGALPKGSKL